MAKVSKPGTPISLTTLEKIVKLQDQEGFLRWKRTMRNHLKIFDLWVYIVEKHERPIEGDAGLDELIKFHDLICTALRICVERNAYFIFILYSCLTSIYNRMVMTDFPPFSFYFYNFA